MAVLVTRPDPDHEATARALRTQGFEAVLAPMLRFEALPFEAEDEVGYVGVIVTSANALRAIAEHPLKAALAALPLFAVGEHTAEVARAIGFGDVIVNQKREARDVGGLSALIATRFGASSDPLALLYLAGADITRDLSADLGAHGFRLVTRTVYRMAPVGVLPRDARAAFAADGIEAILHYSRRSAQAFVNAARGEGVEISALALPQCCLSDTVAQVLRDAGAARVFVARTPDEASMLETVTRAIHGSGAPRRSSRGGQ